MSRIQLAHGKDVTLTNEQVDLLKGVFGVLAEWFYHGLETRASRWRPKTRREHPAFGTGFGVTADVNVGEQSESVRIVVEERADYTFELRLSRSGLRDTAVTAQSGATRSTQWFVTKFTDLPD
jgi:hypothetical protein